jgi:hypothetical protein
VPEIVSSEEMLVKTIVIIPNMIIIAEKAAATIVD